MGRVYDALKRATERNGAPEKHDGDVSDAPARAGETQGRSEATWRPNGDLSQRRRNVAADPAAAPGQPQALDHVWARSSIFKAPDGAQFSAFNERTENPSGPALSGGEPSRVAGATLDAAGSTRIPEFVSIEISATRVEPHLVAITQPRSAHAEKYRSLRTRVLQAGERRKMQAFVVTSSNVMEGKTLTSINLSWLLAQTDGMRALLIDGDLRNPSAADYLGMPERPGLSEVLAGQATLAQAIVRL